MKRVVKPLMESNKEIPETFEELTCTSINDLEVQNTPAVWFTRNAGDNDFLKYNPLEKTICTNKKSKFLFRGAFEVTVPKGYFSNKESIEITVKGKGWFSVKLIYATSTAAGVTTGTSSENWKKYDSVREKEVFMHSAEEYKTKSLQIDSFYNKPFNVAPKAFLKGFTNQEKALIASLEITIRQGDFCFKSVKIK